MLLALPCISESKIKAGKAIDMKHENINSESIQARISDGDLILLVCIYVCVGDV